MLLVIIFIYLFSLNPFRVEDVYTDTFFPAISTVLAVIFGWIPFSFGDVLYTLLWLYLLYLLIKNIVFLVKRGFLWKRFWHKSLKVVLLLLSIYIIFELLWGINYNRLGIASQLGLEPVEYNTSDIIAVQQILLTKVNESKKAVLLSKKPFPNKEELFARANHTYKTASAVFPFLGYQYRPSSIKPTLYSWIGNYVGFTGYYNPFTGEAQVNTSVPAFLQPYIINHEIAHQLGYAKEDEASFAGYLAIIKSNDPLFQYSAYIDLFLFANKEVSYFDSRLAKETFNRLDSNVLKDLEEWRKFNRKYETFIGPLTSRIYAIYLKWNGQPEGMRSYSMVIQMLMAYYKKFGTIN